MLACPLAGNAVRSSMCETLTSPAGRFSAAPTPRARRRPHGPSAAPARARRQPRGCNGWKLFRVKRWPRQVVVLVFISGVFRPVNRDRLGAIAGSGLTELVLQIA